MRFLVSVLAYLVANAVGLLLAIILLDGFRVGFAAFIVAVVIFCAVQAVAEPMLKKVSAKNAPQLMGGISLITIFLGIWITSLLVTDMEIGGLANWLAATLLIWIGSLIASFLLPVYVFKSLRESEG